MARVLNSFTCIPRVHPLTESTIPAFAFPADAGTHLPTPKGWKAELAPRLWTPVPMFARGSRRDYLPPRHVNNLNLSCRKSGCQSVNLRLSKAP